MPVLTKKVQENLNYPVVHSIPGRIRIRIPRLVDDAEYADNIQHLIESLDFVSYVIPFLCNNALNTFCTNYYV